MKGMGNTMPYNQAFVVQHVPEPALVFVTTNKTDFDASQISAAVTYGGA